MALTQIDEASGLHYGNEIQPFDLTRSMQSSGNAHADGCRCAIIKYAFRIKGGDDMLLPKMLDDAKKARRYSQELVETLEKILRSESHACTKDF